MIWRLPCNSVCLHKFFKHRDVVRPLFLRVVYYFLSYDCSSSIYDLFVNVCTIIYFVLSTFIALKIRNIFVFGDLALSFSPSFSHRELYVCVSKKFTLPLIEVQRFYNFIGFAHGPWQGTLMPINWHLSTYFLKNSKLFPFPLAVRVPLPFFSYQKCPQCILWVLRSLSSLNLLLPQIVHPFLLIVLWISITS